MAYVDELVADPRAFIRHYYLSLGPELFNPQPNQKMPDGTVRVKLQDVTGDMTIINNHGELVTPTRPRNRQGLGLLAAKFGGPAESVKATRCFRLTLADGLDPNAIAAYICPYGANQTQSAVLGKDANLMFTAELSGCSFGVGSAASDGSCRVCHANAMDAGNTGGAGAQQASQLASTSLALGSDATQFGPDNYRQVTNEFETRATVVGIRSKDGNWEFWAQIFEMWEAQRNMQVAKFA